jgi:hypothetical protein
MKKGASPIQIIEIIDSLISPNTDINGKDFKNKVKSTYNSIFAKVSKDTKIANLRETVMIHFQEDRLIIKLPQDNRKVDLMSVKIIDGVVDIRVSQQKGNDASFNSSSLSNTLHELKNFINGDKVKEYFHLLPDDLNPLKNKLPYRVDVIIGMFLAIGTTIKKKDGFELKFMSNNDYLRYMGIVSNDICDLDLWVYNEFNKLGHTYDAVDKCDNFDIIYNKCLSLVLNNGNK